MAHYFVLVSVFNDVACLAPVVQKVENTIHWLNLCLLDSAIGSPNTYPLEKDLSVG